MENDYHHTRSGDISDENIKLLQIIFRVQSKFLKVKSMQRMMNERNITNYLYYIHIIHIINYTYNTYNYIHII